jgi:Macrocin-O-methyltransferase (TylF)
MLKGAAPTAGLQAIHNAYLDLLKRSLLGMTVGPATVYLPIKRGRSSIRTWVIRALRRRGGAVLAEPVEFDLSDNAEGTTSVWGLPPWSKTMVGSMRLDNVEACVRSVVEAGVPGDVIETGVWRGGTAIFMRGVLRAYGVTDRQVYVADSFAGVPPPDTQKYPADDGITLHLWPGLAVGLEEVRANFARYGLLDDQVVFVEGWFRDTLPALRSHTWSVLRIDGDLYESTMDALDNLYPGLSPGGWVIVDDYYDIEACAQAVSDYRHQQRITEPLVRVDWTGMCWQKEG